MVEELADLAILILDQLDAPNEDFEPDACAEPANDDEPSLD